MATGLIQLGNWLLLIGALLFILAVLNAVRAGRQLRNAAYYAVRQEALSRTMLYAFHPEWVRWIDNRLGFGHKEEWTPA